MYIGINNNNNKEKMTCYISRFFMRYLCNLLTITMCKIKCQRKVNLQKWLM